MASRGSFKRLEDEKPELRRKSTRLEDEKPELRRTSTEKDIKDIEDRHCTDVCCLLFFVVMWIGLLSIGIFSFFNGDLASIEYGSDYMGNRCGMGNARGCRGSRRKSAPRGEPALSKLQHIECRGVSTLCTPVVAAVAQRLRQDSKAVFGDAKKKACAPSACRPVDDSIDWVRRTYLYRWQAPYATT